MRHAGALALPVFALLTTLGCEGPSAVVDAATGRDAGETTSGSDAGSVVRATTPILPARAGDCPTFTTGQQTIMGLETHIVAGTPTGTPGPMLVAWHGTGGNGRNMISALSGRIRDEVEAQGGLIIAPSDNGMDREGFSPNGVWYETSDLEYVDHLVACAIENHDIDPTRIYTTGCSAGGLMASAMAVKRSHYVAAAAPNSGGLVTSVGVTIQDPTRVPAVMTMHGGAADTVIVNFERTSANLLNYLERFGAFSVDCNHMSGHCGAPRALTESAWDFMLAHPFGTAPSPYQDGLPAELPSYCTIW